jgi:hypothetical protein
VLTINPLENICENANTQAHGGVHLVVLAHLQRRQRFGEENIFQCVLNYMMVLGLELYVDPLCFGSNMHVGCVDLCISFLKCPRSSKSEFKTKSYSRFSVESRAQNFGSGPCPLGPVLGSGPCHLGLVLGSRPCYLGWDHDTWVWTMFSRSG